MYSVDTSVLDCFVLEEDVFVSMNNFGTVASGKDGFGLDALEVEGEHSKMESWRDFPAGSLQVSTGALLLVSFGFGFSTDSE